MKIKKQTKPAKHLISEVDQLIMNTGSYQAIDLLLQLGILPYAEYEQWRMGKIHYLSDTFNGRPEAVNHLLEEADAYVQSLKMQSEPIQLQQWEANADPVDIGKTGYEKNNLQFCPANSVFNNKLSVQYHRETNIAQMDLFFDNRSLVVVNELKRALISRNIRTANQKLQELYNTDPEHELFIPAKNLLDALVNALEEEPITDTEQEMLYLLAELKPLAEKTLSGQERDYMSLFWRRLARHIDDSAYSDSMAKMHSSFCFQQIPDWQAVIKSIEQTPDGTAHPALLARLATALQKSGQRESFIQTICQYCWRFSEQHDKIPIASDIALKNVWHDFLDLELDEQWGIAHFPAWLLIKEPGLSHHITATEYTPKEFKLLHQLVLAEIKENKQSISLREQLKNTHEDMLRYYLKNK